MRVSGRISRILVLGFALWTEGAAARQPCLWTLDMFVAESASRALPRTLGIEVEASIPKDTTYAGVQAEVADYLRGLPGVTDVKLSVGYKHVLQRVEPADLREYRIHFQYEGREYEMSLGLDASVNAPVGRRAIEVRSPILRTEADVGVFLGIIEHLRRNAGMEATPLTGGVHVHVGAKDLGAPEVKTAVRAYRRVRKGVDALFAKTEGREPNTQEFTEKLAKLVEEENGEPSLKTLIRASRDRHRALNLQSLKRFGTLEFRLFNSTVDVEQLVFMADFSMKFVDAVARKDAAIYRVLEKPLDDPATLPALLEALGMRASGKEKEILAKAVAEVEAAEAKKYPWLSTRKRYGIRQAGVSVALLLGAVIVGNAWEEALHPEEPTPTPEPSLPR